MSSLTETAYYSRNIIKYGGALLVFVVIGWSVLMAGVAAYKAAHPPYTPPEMRWGKIPEIVFPEKSFEKKKFSLELPNDALPKYKDQAKVYIVYRPTTTFLALEYDTKTAQALGFVSPPTEIKPNIYEFKNSNTNQTLTMNVLDGSFTMSYPYLNDQLLLNPAKIPSKDEAIQISINYLSNANRLGTDLQEGTKKVSYWKISFDGLKSVPSQSEANLVKVDLIRKNLEEDYKILTTEPNKASVSLLVSGATTDDRKVVEVNYKYLNIDRESFSTYPIISSQEAADKLKNGDYWPAVDTATTNVSIKQMYLAYFEPANLTNYLQPIYVFEGNNFVAYVPAVDETGTEK